MADSNQMTMQPLPATVERDKTEKNKDFGSSNSDAGHIKQQDQRARKRSLWAEVQTRYEQHFDFFSQTGCGAENVSVISM